MSFQRPDPFYASIAELSWQAWDHNWHYLLSRLPNHVQLLPMIKANAYGHGMWPIAQMIKKCPKVAGVGVAHLTEAIDLRNHGWERPIVCMGQVHEAGLEAALYHDITLVLHNEKEVALYQQSKHQPSFHIELDTGLFRTGFSINDLQTVLSQNASWLQNCQGMFTHYADAHRGLTDFSRRQYQIMMQAREQLSAALDRPVILHIEKSGPLLHAQPSAEMDWARPGIALYGYGEKTPQHLQPVLTWKAPIVQINQLKPGDTVGYGRTYKASQPMTIATLAVGYGDGYARSYQPVGVGFRGERHHLCGTICMDYLMIDITGQSQVELGEWVYLMGPGHHGEPTAEELANIDQTIAYEVLTRISPRVARIETS
jgi:alanine racemase